MSKIVYFARYGFQNNISHIEKSYGGDRLNSPNLSGYNYRLCYQCDGGNPIDLYIDKDDVNQIFEEGIETCYRYNSICKYYIENIVSPNDRKYFKIFKSLADSSLLLYLLQIFQQAKFKIYNKISFIPNKEDSGVIIKSTIGCKFLFRNWEPKSIQPDKIYINRIDALECVDKLAQLVK